MASSPSGAAVTKVVMTKHKDSVFGKVESQCIIRFPQIGTKAMGDKQKCPE